MQMVPVKALKDSARISRLCHESGEPVHVTKNGYADMVIMSAEVFEEMAAPSHLCRRASTRSHGASAATPSRPSRRSGASMAYRVQVAGPAERDLDRAVDYLVNVLGAPGAAMSLLDRYEEVLGLLADNPRLFGVDLDVSESAGMQVRRCMARGYELFYLVDDEREVVSVIAFMHGSRDAAPIVGKRI